MGEQEEREMKLKLRVSFWAADWLNPRADWLLPAVGENRDWLRNSRIGHLSSNNTQKNARDMDSGLLMMLFI